MDEAVMPSATLELPQQRVERNVLRLRDRTAGHAVITKLLSVQRTTRPRSRLARALGRSPLTDEAHPWYLGALGEVAVGRLLEKLGPPWHVLHAVPVGKDDSDIDHVVIGPGGVFTINTKHHRGQSVWVAGRTFMVAGHKQPYVRNAEHEARRASKLLTKAADIPVSVTPVVAVVDPKSLTVKEKPSDVVVLTATQLVSWLNKRPAVLTAAQVARVYEVADRSATWRDRSVETVDAGTLRTAFAHLHREVRGARFVRVAWTTAVGGTGVALSAAVGSAPQGSGARRSRGGNRSMPRGGPGRGDDDQDHRGSSGELRSSIGTRALAPRGSTTDSAGAGPRVGCLPAGRGCAGAVGGCRP